MPRIDVPGGRDPLLHLWGGTGNKLTGPVFGVDEACRVPLAPHGRDHLQRVPQG